MQVLVQAMGLEWETDTGLDTELGKVQNLDKGLELVHTLVRELVKGLHQDQGMVLAPRRTLGMVQVQNMEMPLSKVLELPLGTEKGLALVLELVQGRVLDKVMDRALDRVLGRVLGKVLGKALGRGRRKAAALLSMRGIPL